MRNETEANQLKGKLEAEIFQLRDKLVKESRPKAWHWHQLALLEAKAEVLLWVLGERRDFQE